MSKSFMYFENQEGGMSEFRIGHLGEELSNLYGWMDFDCRKQDRKLLKWMETAEVGTFTDHRMGVLVRMKDVEGGAE